MVLRLRLNGFPFVWWAGVMLLLGACPRLPPLDYGKEGPAKSGEELIKRIDAAELQIFSVKGDAKLIVDSPRGKGSVSLFVAVLHPAKLRIEQLDFFGRPEGVLVTDGEHFGLYDSRKGKYFHGPATAHNMSLVVPIALPPRELAALLMGRVPRIPAESSDLVVDESARAYRLTLRQGSVTQRLSVSTGTHRSLSSRVEGLQTYALDADELTPYGLAVLPKHLTLDAEAAKTRVELIYKDIVVNEAPDLTLFDVSAPDGVPVVELNGQGEVAP